MTTDELQREYDALSEQRAAAHVEWQKLCTRAGEAWIKLLKAQCKAELEAEMKSKQSNG